MKQERNLKLHRNRKNSSENDFDKINKAVKRLIIAAAAAAVMTGCASASPTGESAAAAVSEEYDLTGAGSGNTAQAAGAAGTQVQGGSEPGQESAGGSTSAPAGEKEKDSVTIVIPTVYEDVETQQEADEIRDRNGYESAVLEEDGSLVIVMSRSQFDEMIREFKENVDKGISEIINAGGNSSIEKIEYNDDYSVFTVTVSDEELGIIERQAADELIMYGTLYHVYTGNDVDQIRVDYVSAESGEIIETADSGDLDSAY